MIGLQRFHEVVLGRKNWYIEVNNPTLLGDPHCEDVGKGPSAKKTCFCDDNDEGGPPQKTCAEIIWSRWWISCFAKSLSLEK